MAIALLICLMPMPYGYYILIRYISAIAFGVMAYDYYYQKQKKMYVITLSLALLFQPLIKLPLGRDIWNFVDIVTAIFFDLLVFVEKTSLTLLLLFYYLISILKKELVNSASIYQFSFYAIRIPTLKA